MPGHLKKIPQRILISRTDSIGDVVLTLPMAAVLKSNFPEAVISFMGRSYTKPVINACKYVDEFMDADDFLQQTTNVQKIQAIVHVFPTLEMAKQAKVLRIPVRIGTTNRLYHWAYCNKLVKLSRKNSHLHEAQLNIRLLKPFDIRTHYPLDEIELLYGLEKLEPLRNEFSLLLKKETYNLLLHPKSQGSGREWPLENYVQLIRSLDTSRYTIFISGTEKERPLLQPLFEQVGHLVTDITGKMNLSQFISFINACDGLVASGTGPIHLAAALGKDAMGIYPPLRPIHPGRWRPVGPKANVFVVEKDCNACTGNPSACSCIKEVRPEWIKNYLDKVSAL